MKLSIESELQRQRQLTLIIIATDAIYKMAKYWFDAKYYREDPQFWYLCQILNSNVTAITLYVARTVTKPRKNETVAKCTFFWESVFNRIVELEGEESIINIVCYLEAMSCLVADVITQCKDYSIRRRFKWLYKIMNNMLECLYKLTQEEDKIVNAGVQWYNTCRGFLHGAYAADGKPKYKQKQRRKGNQKRK